MASRIFGDSLKSHYWQQFKLTILCTVPILQFLSQCVGRSKRPATVYVVQKITQWLWCQTISVHHIEAIYKHASINHLVDGVIMWICTLDGTGRLLNTISNGILRQERLLQIIFNSQWLSTQAITQLLIRSALLYVLLNQQPKGICSCLKLDVFLLLVATLHCFCL